MQSKLIEFCRARKQPATVLPDMGEASEVVWMLRKGSLRDTFQENQVQSWNPRRDGWRLKPESYRAPEEELRLLPELEQALSQAHKMEILGQMADGLAHNFNNLLQGVMSAMNLMHSRIDPRDTRELDFLMGHAFASIEGVGSLTQRLLEFSRPRRPDARPVDLNTKIAAMQDLLKCTLLPRFTLRVEPGEGPMRTTCDVHQLENTILDLVINAREAMPGGGTITIKTELADLALERPGLAHGDYVSVCVSDQGQGMAPDILARAFDPLFTSKKTGHRVGLGLPLAELFAERSQGYIGIESAVGQGTHVWLYLPCDPN